MSTAICNSCSELVHWHARRGEKLRDQKCPCGSSDLTAIAGHLNGDEWIYTDRKGIVKKVVPQGAYQYGATDQR